MGETDNRLNFDAENLIREYQRLLGNSAYHLGMVAITQEQWRELGQRVAALEAERDRLRLLFCEQYARHQAQAMGIRWRDWHDEQKAQWRNEAGEWLDGTRERLDSHGAGPTMTEMLAGATTPGSGQAGA